METTKIIRKALAFLLGLALVGTLLPAAPVCAEEAAPESEPLPAKFDLRERGVVTPVKQQSPWGTCWSFGLIAAAETSILTDMGKTYAETGLDLSERHLIYFAMTPVTKEQSESQYDEGLYWPGGEGNTNAAYRGSLGTVASTLFSTGVGPLPEEDFPYQNNLGMTEYEYMQAYPDEWKGFVKADTERSKGVTLAELIQRNSANPKYAKTEAEYLQTCWDNYLKKVTERDYYTKYLDWWIDSSHRNKSAGYVLIDGNELPEHAWRDWKGTWVGLSRHGVEATKKELMRGRIVSVDFHADSTTPDQLDNEGKYINLDTWAHYAYQDIDRNHRVAIVGWDDDYPKENFLSGTDAEGNSKTPPANGAWIVKNSWGSETDATTNEGGRPINKGAWGIKDGEGRSTGYFYLSYYDKSITQPESYKFGTDLSAGDYFSAYQYDYLPAHGGFYFLKGGSHVSTANVYTIDPDEDEVLTSIGLRTLAENSTAEVEVYRLGPGVTNPEGGEKVASFSKTFEYAGFHRVALPEPVTLAPGTRFTVKSTIYSKDEDGNPTYYVIVNKAYCEEYARELLESRNLTYSYGKSVINKGESFIHFKSGGWFDWRECIDNDMNTDGLKSYGEVGAEAEVAADATSGQSEASEPQANDVGSSEASRYPKPIYVNEFVIDNFTLKAFTVPASAFVAGDPAPVGDQLSEEDSMKDDGTETGATWPEDGFTDGSQPSESAATSDPGIPDMEKDYFADWDDTDPGDTGEDPSPGDEDPGDNEEDPTADGTDQGEPEENPTTDDKDPSDAGEDTSSDGEDTAAKPAPQPQAPATPPQSGTPTTQQQTTQAASTPPKALPDTGDSTFVLLAPLALIGVCALALGFSRRRAT